MRCFLAIELSDRARQHLARVQEALRGELPMISYPRPENLHVTLKFLGDVDGARLTALCESLARVKLSGTVEIRAAQLDAFPPHGPARILVATMTGSDGVVSALHDAIEQRARKLGFDAEHRRYRPHVTLARAKAGVRRGQLDRAAETFAELWPGPRCGVNEFVLFQSQLHPTGSRYIKLATFAPFG
jgi:2'-5' RNA ligase